MRTRRNSVVLLAVLALIAVGSALLHGGKVKAQTGGAGLLGTGAGPGGGSHVRVFDNNGNPTAVSFFAYPPGFAGGVHIAMGDVDGDGFPEIITGAGAGGGPHVRGFTVDTSNGSVVPVGSVFAYDPAFPGGVYVAGRVGLDVVTGAGPGGGPHVRTFDGQTGQGTATSFFAYPTGFGGGVAVG